MKEVEKHQNEILSLFSSAMLLREVLEQTQKDLGMYAPVDFLAEEHVVSPEKAIETLSFCLYELSRRSHSALMEVMYRADVRENLLHQTLTDPDLSEKQKARDLAFLLLDRELRKVLTRKQWSHKQDDQEK